MLELPPTQAVEILHFTDSSSYSQGDHSRNWQQNGSVSGEITTTSSEPSNSNSE
ncbi:hypothetical protein DY000_02013695 [Brassica cretica]|uniref:Uncharacterized protein n=1 Tax=Brassica cretica TaxID=69181 RepID=A0ABQ7D858_BRACR|nr:hypothetical protein DY000_02013695 [Brassica cretica]